MNRRWLVIVGAWHLYGLYFFNQSVFFYRTLSDGLPWQESLQRALLTTWFWIALTPVILAIVDRLRRRDVPPAPALVVHVGLALTVALLNAALDYARILLVHRSPGEGFGFQALYQLSENCLLYAVLVLIAHVAHLHAREREREGKAARLEARLARSELQLLRMQLRPHFLFNTFQSVSTLIHSNPEAADRMVGRLSDLLRLSIRHGADDLATVAVELAALDLYLGIQRLRYEHRLVVDVNADDATRGYALPHLLLQPLVENAIVHGFGPDHESLHVCVAIASVGDRLRIEVRDDGRGTAAHDDSPSAGMGVGLLNTQARLRRLYGDDASLTLHSTTGAGFTAIVEIPVDADGSGPADPEVDALQQTGVS